MPGLLTLAARSFNLGSTHHVLDLRTGNRAAALRLARDFGCHVTAVDEDEPSLRIAREVADHSGLGGLVKFKAMDLGHWTLPAREFDLVLALGGALTATDRVRGLDQIAVHLVPGGGLLIADLVYLDGPASAAAKDLLRDLSGLEGETVEEREHRPEPIVRAIFEQGRFHFANEPEYRGLLEAFGYETVFSTLMPETAWGEYFERMARAAGAMDSPHCDRQARAYIAQEAGAFYGYGGRGTVGYWFAGARHVGFHEP
ncbi:MAG: class I SAM-dependent methyltransferase [Candidatus Eisenbacteria bacterium]